MYAKIDGSSDCVELQSSFDTAMSNVDAREPGDELRAVSLSYAQAADSRMREVGCYG